MSAAIVLPPSRPVKQPKARIPHVTLDLVFGATVIIASAATPRGDQ